MSSTTPYTYEGHASSGTTANRPSNVQPGFHYFDTTIGQSLVYTGSAWVLEDGSAIGVAAVNAAGTVQANAGALSTGLNIVAAADGTTGVVLPTASAGMICTVINNDDADSALKVYPAVNAAINLAAANAALSMATNTSAVFRAQSATQWWTIPRVPS